jgi:hypothetical protein
MKLLKQVTLEMAVRGGDLTLVSDAWAEKLEKQINDGQLTFKEVGTIDSMVVKSHLFTHTLWLGDEMVFAAQVDKIPGNTCSIDDIWVKSSFRGQKLLSKFLIWLKVDQKQHTIKLGEVHSDDTYNLLKAGGLRAFKKHWENFHGDVKPFSAETIDDFYGKGRWKLVLENDTDLGWLQPTGGFTHTYEALVNVFDNHDEI